MLFLHSSENLVFILSQDDPGVTRKENREEEAYIFFLPYCFAWRKGSKARPSSTAKLRETLKTWRKRDSVFEQIDQIMIRRRKIERFIESVRALPEFITEFDESLWAGLVDSVTVYDKDRIVWKLTCGMEMES